MTLPRLPSTSDRLRIVATSDNHLGRYHDRMPPARLEARRAALRRSFAAVIDGALADRADLLILAGDLFDTPDPRNVERVFVAEQLGRLQAAGIPAVAIGGNHDTPRQRTEQGGRTPQEVFARLGALTLLHDSGGLATQTFAWGDRTVAIGGLGWNPTRLPGQDPLRDLDWRPDADLAILVCHHSIEGHIYPGANEPIVTLETLDALGGVSLVIAGHVHREAILRLPDRTVVLPGATERLTFGEIEGTPGYWRIDLDPAGRPVEIARRPVPHQPRRDLTVPAADLAGEDPGTLLRERLVASIRDPEALVRLRLTGPIRRSVYQAIDPRGLIEFALARSFSFDLDTSELYLADERGAAAARGVRLSPAEEIARAADELAADDPDPRWIAARDRILADLRKGAGP